MGELGARLKAVPHNPSMTSPSPPVTATAASNELDEGGSLPRPRFDYSFYHRLYQAPMITKTHPVGIRSGPDLTFAVSESEKYFIDNPIKQRIVYECTELLKEIQVEQVYHAFIIYITFCNYLLSVQKIKEYHCAEQRACD